MCSTFFVQSLVRAAYSRFLPIFSMRLSKSWWLWEKKREKTVLSISLSLMHTHKSALTRSVLFFPCSEHFNIHRCSYEALRLWQRLCYVYTAFLSIASSSIFLVWWTASKGALSSLCIGKDIFILSRIRGFTIHFGLEWCQPSEKCCKSIFHGVLRTIWHPCTLFFWKREQGDGSEYADKLGSDEYGRAIKCERGNTRSVNGEGVAKNAVTREN